MDGRRRFKSLLMVISERGEWPRSDEKLYTFYGRAEETKKQKEQKAKTIQKDIERAKKKGMAKVERKGM